MERVAIYPGTFDPITLGHIDVIETSAAIFDKVVVGLLINPLKKPMFTEEERVMMIEKSMKEYGIINVSVKTFHGLVVEFAHQERALVIVRGLRLTTEYEDELSFSFNNRMLDQKIHTILIAPLQEHIHISSSNVRELAFFGRTELDKYLPQTVITYISQRK